ncbi:MAG TPA: ATP-binding protein [Chitinophagaceae bacterium]|nr:ATP-binding protein [Chitinophagaceae bacterium]
MKKIFLLLLLCNIAKLVTAQEHIKDSLLAFLSKAKEDTLRVNLLYDLGNYYGEKSMADSAIYWETQGLTLAQKTGYKKGEIENTADAANNYWDIGDFMTAIKLGTSVYNYGVSVNDTDIMESAMEPLINAYRDEGDFRESLKFVYKFIALDRYPDSSNNAIVYAVIGSDYYGMGKYDSANIFLTRARSFDKYDNYTAGWILLMSGRLFEKLINDSFALRYYRQSIVKLKDENDLKDLAGAYNSVASLYRKASQTDSTIYYANQALNLDEQYKFNNEKAETYLILSKVYEKVNTGKAFDYYKLAISTRDSLFNQEKQRQISSFKFNEELRQNEIITAKREYESRIRTYILAGLLVFLLAFMIVLFRNNRQKQKAKTKIEKAYSDLTATQAQLIQSEKMASLGELTAGIAHEIQNPLNFINNFSEVDIELIDELHAAISSGNTTEVEQVMDSLKNNLLKINHHGKRADAIVKGMLQHSRASTGQLEPTNINTLAEEYFRLSYHGLRARDKSFNSAMESHFDENTGKINIVPQDLGRVLLNIFNNAFYAVFEKKKLRGETYSPLVTLSTRKEPDRVKIMIRDNGVGIPPQIIDKIFQPFFTTKSPGHGTGLGLSLSYDMIKNMGGKIQVTSIENEETLFIIELPI